jgi:tetratricopeptide (TPR) repeat protein
MRISRAVRSTALLTSGLALLATALPADAQRSPIGRQQRPQREQQQQPQQPADGLQITAEERAAIVPVQTAVQAQDWTAAAAALPAAQAAATTPYGRYVVSRLQLEIAEGTQNAQLRAQAVEAMLASGAAPAEALPPLLGAQSSIAIEAQNWPLAEQALTRLLELEPGNAERLRLLAEVQIRQNKLNEALANYQRLIATGETSGQRAAEEHYRRALAVARQLRAAEATAQLGRTLLTAYPTQQNWQEALRLYRQTSGEQADVALDLRRLMRAAGAFSDQADYLEFADRLVRAGLLGEAKAVLDEGISRNVLRANDSTVAGMMNSVSGRINEDRASLTTARTQALAGSGRQARIAGDAYMSYGQYAEAVELYRAGVQKGGEDANLLNLRLGIALALAGQRAEAETALRAVTGSRAELAGYWLLWLNRAGS